VSILTVKTTMRLLLPLCVVKRVMSGPLTDLRQVLFHPHEAEVYHASDALMLIANKHSYREPPAVLTEMARRVRAGEALVLPPIPVRVPEAGFRHGVDVEGSGYVRREPVLVPSRAFRRSWKHLKRVGN
jgi:hypothetical protein